MRHAVHGLQTTTAAPTTVPEPRRRLFARVVVPLALLGATVALAAWSSREMWLPRTLVRVLPVVAKPAGENGASGAVTVQAPGWLEPDPFPVYATALVEGVVREVTVLEGQAVAAGDVVARLVDDELRLAVQRATAERDEQRAGVQSAAAELRAARTAAERLVERNLARDVATAAQAELVAAGEQLRAELDAAQARLAGTGDELARKEQLEVGVAVSTGELARLRLRVAAETADLTALRARGKVLEAQSAKAAAELHAAALALDLKVAETRALALAEAAAAQAQARALRAETALAEATLALARAEVRAPSAGVVQRRFVHPGSVLMRREAGHPMVVAQLYEPRKLQARVEVPLADAAQVGVGQRAQVSVEVLPGKQFAAVVTRVVHEADIARNTVQVKVALDDPDPLLKPEMLARVRFLAAPAAGAAATSRLRLLAPRAGVRGEGAMARAFVALDLGRGRALAQARTVRVGMSDGEWVEVEDGLRPGDQVIVEAAGELADGQRLTIAEAR